MSDGSPVPPWVAVDGHVHVHRAFRPVPFLSSALDNLSRARMPGRADGPAMGYLLFAESYGDTIWDTWSEWAERGESLRGLDVRPTTEPISLVVRREGRPVTALVRGRQIRCSDGLEVLALGHEGTPPDGRPLRDTVDALADHAGLVVIPWGFGKWWGRRGRRVSETLARHPFVRLGDNGGRPRVSPTPPSIRRERARGHAVLSGSDPLPFADHEGRAGSYGFALEAPLDPEAPFAALTRALAVSDAVATFGRRRSAAGFVADQVRLRLRKARSM